MWSKGSSSSDHEHLTQIVTGCSTSNYSDNLSYDAFTWIELQEAHDRVKSRYATGWHSNGHSRQSKGEENIPHTGMQVPFEIAINPKTGLRQVKVTRDIPEGYPIWKPLHYVTFRSEHAYVEFLEELPHHLQCEALSWTHPSWMNNEMFVDITLDEGTFIQESSNPMDINIDINTAAARDIKAGEFIYGNHTDYMHSTSSSASSPYAVSGVEWLDDLRSTAWKRTGLGMGRRSSSQTTSRSRSSNSRHHHSNAPPSIIPGVTVLSALYIVFKFVRASKQTQSFSRVCDSPNYGSSFFGSQKNKLS